MLSCQQTQNVIDGKKRIILNPGEQQKKDFETATFAEYEVYGIDILVTSGEDGKVRFFLNHWSGICGEKSEKITDCYTFHRLARRTRRQLSTSAIRLCHISSR